MIDMKATLKIKDSIKLINLINTNIEAFNKELKHYVKLHYKNNKKLKEFLVLYYISYYVTYFDGVDETYMSYYGQPTAKTEYESSSNKLSLRILDDFENLLKDTIVHFEENYTLLLKNKLVKIPKYLQINGYQPY